MNKFHIPLKGRTTDTGATISLVSSVDCDLRCEYDGKTLTSSEDDYFEALVQLRLQLEAQGLLLHCNGAGLNVYPSMMGRQMGEGLFAYHLHMGQQSKMEDLVNIFETSADILPATVADQAAFYKAWTNSKRN